MNQENIIRNEKILKFEEECDKLTQKIVEEGVECDYTKDRRTSIVNTVFLVNGKENEYASVIMFSDGTLEAIKYNYLNSDSDVVYMNGKGTKFVNDRKRDLYTQDGVEIFIQSNTICQVGVNTKIEPLVIGDNVQDSRDITKWDLSNPDKWQVVPMARR